MLMPHTQRWRWWRSNKCHVLFLSSCASFSLDYDELRWVPGLWALDLLTLVFFCFFDFYHDHL